jgi:DNA-binding NarL/FixJ family response regulator
MNEALSDDSRHSPAGGGSAPEIGVILVGAEELTRASLRLLLDRQPGLRVIGEADTCAAALAQARGCETDLFVLDFDIAAAIATLVEIRAADSEARVIVLIASRDLGGARRVVLAGASGVVFKDSSPDHLRKAMLKVHEGELWADRLTTAQLISDLAARRRQQAADPEERKIRSLSSRERELVTLVVEGLSNKRIAVRLGLSEHTIRHHLTSTFAKLGLPDRVALVAYAFRHDLARPSR